jgi:NDP-sugar pyrophosphorylase family protein
MLDEPSRLYAMATDAYWIDIGTPGKYLEAHADVLRGVFGRPPAPRAQESAPGIWFQGDVKVDRDAKLEAPVLVGAGTSIGSGAHVVGSVVGAGCVVGAGARVQRAVLHDGAVLDERVEVIDAVIGAGARAHADAVASDQTIVGPQAVLGAGTRASGARIRRLEPDDAGA